VNAGYVAAGCTAGSAGAFRIDSASPVMGGPYTARAETESKTVTDKRFGTRVFVSGLVDRKGLPIDPVYVDGVLNQLPTVLDARVNDEGSANNPLSLPLLWLDTRRCDGTTLPTGSAIEASQYEYRVLARIGATAAHQTMDVDPLGKPAIGLGKPTASTPLGARVHVLSDGTADASGVDVQARLTMPTQLVAFRPLLDVCDDSTPPNEIFSCQSQQMFTRDARTFASMKLLSTIADYGAADVLVRIRGHHTTDDPDAPASPNECLTGPGGKKVCDLDVVGHVDHVPGMVQVLASYVTNRRAPNLDAKFEIDTLGANPALFSTIGAVHATVLDDASPAYVGNGATKARTSNYDVSLTGVEHAIHAELVYQGSDSLPSHHNVCPDHNYVGRGSMGVEYIHAEVDVGVATSVVARARVDVLGRLETELMTDQPVNGTVYAKAKNVGFGYKDEILTVFDTSDIDLCIDVDLPFRMTLQNTTVARLGVDQTTWALQTATSSQKITLRFGERQADGSFLSGARWFKHYAHYDPEGPGDWLYTQSGRRAVYLMPVPYWNGTEILNNFDDEWALANQISTGTMFGNDDEPTCCVAGNKTTFLLDLFWNQSIRDDMYCRDRPACVPDFAGRPGFEVHKAIWQRGHLPPTGNLVMGALSNPNPAPATTGSVSLTTSGTDNAMEVETSKYAFATGTVLTGIDGTRYRIYFGPSNPSEDNDPTKMVVSLAGDYSNGVARWRREMTSYTPTLCLVSFPCTVSGTMERLPSGLVLVNWNLHVHNGTFYDDVDGQFIVDPSGYGGAVSTLWESMSATHGQPTTVEHGFTDPGFDTFETKKVVYLGDGTIVDQGTSVGAAAPVTHTYAFPGKYPGVIVYYSWQADHWKPLYVLPFEMTVS
jgi:hypothetical protein